MKKVIILIFFLTTISSLFASNRSTFMKIDSEYYDRSNVNIKISNDANTASVTIVDGTFNEIVTITAVTTYDCNGKKVDAYLVPHYGQQSFDTKDITITALTNDEGNISQVTVYNLPNGVYIARSYRRHTGQEITFGANGKPFGVYFDGEEDYFTVLKDY